MAEPIFKSIKYARQEELDSLRAAVEDLMGRLTIFERALAVTIEDVEGLVIYLGETKAAEDEEPAGQTDDAEVLRRGRPEVPDEERFEPEYDEMPEEEVARLRAEAAAAFEEANQNADE